MIKKTYRKVLMFVLTVITVNAFAQSDETAVKQVVNTLFEGMRKTDTAMIRTTFYTTPILQTVLKNREGKTMVHSEPLDSFLISISKPRKEVYDERITFDVIRVDGDLAMVWASYKFYIGDKFSHCGVDSFQMIRIDGVWKILYLVDTRRRQNCD